MSNYSQEDYEWNKTKNFQGNWEWGTLFAGIPMNCNYYVFHQISRILAENPQIKSICEIGQCTGSMTIYLALEAVRKKIPCHSWDITRQITPETEVILNSLHVRSHYMDVFAYKENIISMINTEPVYLICDGGDKKREAEMFVPHLKSGSIVSIHDYGREVFDADLIPIQDKVMPIRPHEWNLHNSQFCSLRVK